jgi:tryptophan synthase alpha chain
VIRSEGRAGLIPFLTAGFPDLPASLDALRLMETCGADIVEVGIPFSDPLADGPTIQRSSFVALEKGATVPKALDLVHRAGLGIPVVLMTYLNPVLAYGLERFLGDAAAAGVSGLLLTDLPAGADPATEQAVRDSSLASIRLVAPTTPKDRLPVVLDGAGGFVYVVSRLGVTGAQRHLDAAVRASVGAVRAATDLPVAVGFGIANVEQAAQAAALADGVVVGSALVEALDRDGLAGAERLVRQLRRAVERRAA